jgi:hypothetical protein
MRTLRDVCRDLDVTYKTLDKWMKRLDITPERHPRDYRFWCLDDEQVEEIRRARSEMPGGAPARINPPRRLNTKTPQAQQSDLALSASLVYGGLPDGLVSLESFAREHHIARQTAMKGVSSGRLAVITGEWTVYRGHAKYALDAAGRAQFVRLWGDRPGWHPCPHCPHEESEEV